MFFRRICSLGQLVHQLAQIPDIPYQQVPYPDTADLVGDEGTVRIHGGGTLKKVSAGDAGPLQPGEVRQRVPGETGSYLVHLRPGAALFHL